MMFFVIWKKLLRNYKFFLRINQIEAYLYLFDSTVSKIFVSAFRTALPLFSNLFAVCDRSISTAWILERGDFVLLAYFTL